MPMIDLTVPQGAVDASRLVDDLTKTLLKWEGVPDNPVADGISWGYVTRSRPAPTTSVIRPMTTVRPATA